MVTGSKRAVRRPQSAGVVVPRQPRWRQRLGARLVFLLVRGVSATLRYRWNDRSGLFDGAPSEPAIYCVWHNRLALCFTAYFGYARKSSPAPGLAAMVSASKDGAFLAAILECFKVRPVRGSSSRRGPQALLELTTWSERGYDLAITPDGPRGPPLRGAGGHHLAGSAHGAADYPLFLSPKLENLRQELGPVSNPAAVLALRNECRKADPHPARRFRGGTRGAAATIGADPQRAFAGLNVRGRLRRTPHDSAPSAA